MSIGAGNMGHSWTKPCVFDRNPVDVQDAVGKVLNHHENNTIGVPLPVLYALESGVEAAD